jgi:hypothetical protein
MCRITKSILHSVAPLILLHFSDLTGGALVTSVSGWLNANFTIGNGEITATEFKRLLIDLRLS